MAVQLVAAERGEIAEVRVDRSRVGDHVGRTDAETQAEVIAVEVEQTEGALDVRHETTLPDVAHGELAPELEDVEVLVAHLGQLRVADDHREVLAEVAAVVELQIPHVPIVVARTAAAGEGVPGAEDRDFAPLRLRHRLAGKQRKDDSEGK